MHIFNSPNVACVVHAEVVISHIGLCMPLGACDIPRSTCNRLRRVCNISHITCEDHAETGTAHIEPLVVPMAAMKDHTETETSHIEAVVSLMFSFEPNDTTYEKMAKLFFIFLSERVLVLLDPH